MSWSDVTYPEFPFPPPQNMGMACYPNNITMVACNIYQVEFFFSNTYCSLGKKKFGHFQIQFTIHNWPW